MSELYRAPKFVALAAAVALGGGWPYGLWWRTGKIRPTSIECYLHRGKLSGAAPQSMAKSPRQSKCAYYSQGVARY